MRNSNTPTLFSKGDTVLCPSIGDFAYKLFHDQETDCLGFTANGKTYHYRSDGKVSRDDKAPSLFHDTAANRQAVNTLYGSTYPAQTRQRKTIDMTTADDDEVMLIPSIMLSDVACDINGAATVLHDMSQLLGLIHYRKIEPHTAVAMARLSQDAAETWINLLYSQLDIINEPLAQSGFGKVDPCAY